MEPSVSETGGHAPASETAPQDVGQPPPEGGWDPYDVWHTRILAPRLENQAPPSSLDDTAQASPPLSLVQPSGRHRRREDKFDPEVRARLKKRLQGTWSGITGQGFTAAAAACAARIPATFGSEQDAMPTEKATGLQRMVRATLFSLAGLRAAWRGEAAFRQECALALVMIPAAFWLGQTPLECAALIGVVLLVLIVELLNSGIEAAVDRIGSDHHELSGRAKDMGSAAVFLSLLLTLVVWGAIAWQRFGAAVFQI